MKNILIGIVMMFTALHADFNRDDATNIVTDNTTSLQWQDDAVGSTMEWQEAIDYCENTLTLGDYSDWRLPNKKELLSIVDYSKYNPSIDSQFQNITSSNYWSSTTHANGTGNAWVVSFYDGYTYDYSKDTDTYVRCVRSGQ